MSSAHLSYRIFSTEDRPKAVTFVVHGMQEHKERYEEFAQVLNSHGIAFITYDLPGHGQDCPDEDLGWFGEKKGWDNLVDSAVDIAELARKTFPGVPVVYFGHSMGTMIGRTFLQEHDDLIDAMVLSGAPNYQGAASIGIAVANCVSLFKGKKGHSKLLDTMATGSFNKSVENPRTPVDWLSYNTDNVDTYVKDKYCGFPFTVQGYHDLFEGMLRMHDTKAFKVKKPYLPIWMYAGKDDPCRGGDDGFADSVNNLKKAGYRNVTSSLYEGMRHETMHEKDGRKVMEDTAAWILANI
jgi:alpha-beta hydrolase superfamily lysophospholipase